MTTTSLFARALSAMTVPLASIIIPAFNEEENIEAILAEINEAKKESWLPYEIIVVDDGSTDRTREIASGKGAIVLTKSVNQGKSDALRRGFRHAHGDIIVTMDADGSHEPHDIKRLIAPILEGADVVLGSRFADRERGGSTKRLHIFGNALINLAIFLMTGTILTDSQTGFRAFRKEVIQKISITSEGYQVETEFTVKALINGYVVKEVPIGLRDRKNGLSHLNPLFDGAKIFATMLKSIMNNSAINALSSA